MANKIEPKQNIQKSCVYLKGVKQKNAQWFRTQAKALGYNMNEFFDKLIEGQSASKTIGPRASRKKLTKVK